MKWKKVLRLLCDRDGWISGRDIGDALGITRASVWKYIRFLRSEGYILRSESANGYLLEYPADTPVVLEHADFGAEILGSTVIPYTSISSTNVEALAVADTAPDGTVLIAEHQTAGRGRRGRSWVSPFGKGIYATFILKPEVPVFKTPRLTLVAGVAAGRALRDFGIDVTLRWPNDLMAGSRKIGGILSELHAEGDAARYVIAGIGLNVGTEKADFPGELQQMAGSILSEYGTRLSRRELLKALTVSFDRCYRDFIKSGGELKDMRKDWESMAYGMNSFVTITTGKDKERCKVLGLREDGVLLVEVERKVKEVYAGEVL